MGAQLCAPTEEGCNGIGSAIFMAIADALDMATHEK